VSCFRRYVWLLLTLLLGAPALGKPYLPIDDGTVLERLPEKTDPSLREVKRLRAALARNPGDITLAASLARRAIEAGRETGDPRFFGQAQAALAPWWNESNPPAQALLLRATLKQSTHDFPGALADLDRLIAANPRAGQALLTRATVLTVQGRYAEARADCARIARLTMPLVTIACDAAPASVIDDGHPLNPGNPGGNEDQPAGAARNPIEHRQRMHRRSAVRISRADGCACRSRRRRWSDRMGTYARRRDRATPR